MKIWMALIVAILSISSCSSLKKSKGSHKSNVSSLKSSDPTLNDPSIEEAATEEEDESSDLTQSDEQTPEDLGEVEASQARGADEIEADKLASTTFPLVHNEFVEQWVRYFSGRGRDFFGKWLARSTRYIPLMKEILRKEGVPEDLIYLAMIESGFNTKAKSRAKAVGPWQFIKDTGKRYDMDVGFWIDERRDFIKSTVAAARYLKELYQIFGSWYLAAAGYNAGEGKVLFAVRRDRNRNFWELIRTKENFRAETRNYVPKIIAAAMVSKNPKKYGFESIAFEEPFRWETIRLPGGVRFKQIAAITSTDLELIDLLNPEFRREMTPPGSQSYDIRVPVGTAAVLEARISELSTHSKGFFVTHRVKRGESLGSIARRYRADIQEIKDLNNISKVTRLRVGQELSIPQSDANPNKTRSKKNSFVKAKNEAPTAPAESLDGDQYIVQSGDTLWGLSKKYNVSVEELKRANNIRGKKDFRAGSKITIPKKAGSDSGALKTYKQKVHASRIKKSKALRAR